MPKLDAYKPLIDQWRLDDRKAPQEAAPYCKKVFMRLQTEPGDFDCSYRLVAQYVAYRKSQMHLDSKKGPICLLSTSPARVRLISVPYSSFEKQFYPLKKSIWCFLSFPFSNAGYLQLMYGEKYRVFHGGHD